MNHQQASRNFLSADTWPLRHHARAMNHSEIKTGGSGCIDAFQTKESATNPKLSKEEFFSRIYYDDHISSVLLTWYFDKCLMRECQHRKVWVSQKIVVSFPDAFKQQSCFFWKIRAPIIALIGFIAVVLYRGCFGTPRYILLLVESLSVCIRNVKWTYWKTLNVFPYFFRKKLVYICRVPPLMG